MKGSVDEEELLKYLNDELSNAEKQAVESYLIEDGFDADALEGLFDINDKKRIQLIVDGLNQDLKKKILRRKFRSNHLKLKPSWSLYFSLLILLILIVMIFLFLHQRLP